MHAHSHLCMHAHMPVWHNSFTGKNCKFEIQAPIWQNAASLSGVGLILSCTKLECVCWEAFKAEERLAMVNTNLFTINRNLLYLSCTIQKVFSDNREHILLWEKMFTINKVFYKQGCTKWNLPHRKILLLVPKTFLYQSFTGIFFYWMLVHL